MYRDIINELLESTRTGDRAGAALSLETWRDTYEDDGLLESVPEPFLNNVGEEWGRGSLSLAQAYVANKIVEDAINIKKDIPYNTPSENIRAMIQAVNRVVR